MKIDPIAREILWHRLVAITDAAAATCIRTSFSMVVRQWLDTASMVGQTA
jgi:N-methylhydantoinase B/oxoprolinase/acetone carboxylase alpha subunit